MQRLHALILRCESARAGGVDDQEHLTLEPPERNLFTGERLSGEIIDTCHPNSFDLAHRIDRSRRRATGFDRLTRSQAKVLAVAAGNDLDADWNPPDQARRDR